MKSKEIKYNEFTIAVRRWKRRWYYSVPFVGKKRIEKASNKLAKEIGACFKHAPYQYFADQPN